MEPAIDVSVIVPTFRRPGPLAEALQSALSQSGVRLEMVVLDDSPEGSARAVVERIGDPRVRYRKMPVPSGGRPALVRNAGIPLARGRYLHFLDDDDRMEPGAYAALAAALDRRPQIGVAFGRIEPFGNDVRKLEREQEYFARAARRARWAHRLGDPRRLIVGCMLFHETVLVCSAGMIRRSCLLPGNEFDINCIVMEDVEFYLRNIRRFGYIFIDRKVLNYRTGDKSLMNNLDSNVNIIKSYEKIYEIYREKFGIAEWIIIKIFMRTLFSKL